MNVLIIGAGAIGSLVGARLATRHGSVTLAGRPRTVETVREHGLYLEDESGRRRIEDIHVTGSLSDAFAQTKDAFDLAVLTVKSYDTAAAVNEFADAAERYGHTIPIVVSLQNGVGNEETLAARIGPERVIAGTITTPVSIPQPGVIRVDRPQYTVGLSDWQPGAPQPDADTVRTLLAQAGFSATCYAHARGMKWTKLLMNMAGNATSAILGVPPDQVYARNKMADLEIDAWREALRVMAAAGIPPQNVGSYPFKTLAPFIRFAPRRVLRPILRKRIGKARGGKMPSLYLDLESGKGRSEVEWLNGAVVSAGRAAGVATPVNQALTGTLLRLVDDPTQRADWRENYARLAEAGAGA
ncbi:MAG: ketopantoate reductase family protein [Caldilineaceae bacterium]|nr:ketopantoate reductase family protein [Caldilineaceae bacterium]